MPDGITANAGGREYASSGARMIPPIPAQNRTGARAFALVMRWLVRIAALTHRRRADLFDRVHPGHGHPQLETQPV